ncbi:MAG: hypothetical protein ACRCZF_20620 [Gemmataceae bacterium]
MMPPVRDSHATGFAPPADFTLDALLAQWPEALRPALLPSLPPSAPLPTFPWRTEERGSFPLHQSQHDAILSTPDYLLSRTPGADWSILLQGADRILWVLPNPAQADERLAAWPDAVRAVAPEETLADWPIARLEQTSSSRGEAPVHRARQTLQATIDQTEHRLARAAELETLWSEWQQPGPDPKTRLRLLSEQEALGQERLPLTTEVAVLPTPNPIHRQELQKQWDTCLAERTELERSLAARRSGNLFSGAFWKARLNTDLERRVEALNHQLVELNQALSATPLPESRPEPAAEVDKRLAEETAQRQAAIDAELQEFDKSVARRQRIQAELDAAGLLWGEEPEPAHRWERFQAERQETQNGLAFARHYLHELNGGTAMTRKLLARSRLVIAPQGALADPALTAAPFDWVIIEEAEAYTREALQPFLDRGRRWILIGQPEVPSPFADLWNQCDSPGVNQTAEGFLSDFHPEVASEQMEDCLDDPRLQLHFGHAHTGEFVLARILVRVPDAVLARALLREHLSDAELPAANPRIVS